MLSLMARTEGSDAGWSWPHQSSLAESFGVSVSSIERAVAELERAGWVERRRTRLGNAYRVLEACALPDAVASPETGYAAPVAGAASDPSC